MKRLYRSNKDKVFEGVCGGIGEYLDIDPVLVRLLWILLIMFGGSGVVAYLVAMFIIPKQPEESDPDLAAGKEVTQVTISNRLWGVLLVIAGALLLMGFLGPIGGLFMGITAFMGHTLWPFIVIGLGLYLFFNQSDSGNVKSSMEEVFPPGQKLYRSKTDRKLSGLCGGLAAYFNVDSNIIRIFWAIGTLGSFGFGILAYVFLSIFLKEAEV